MLPAFLGSGIGKRLFGRASRHAPEFTFTSDPHADGFYLKLGAQKIGEVYSVYQETMLSRFVYCAEGSA